MFPSMRRSKQAMSQEEIKDVLDRGTSGVLSLLGEEGYPYGVPMNYVFLGDRILFHSAKKGHKIQAMERCNKASFCVIDQDEIIPQEYTSYFRSVIVFGRLHFLQGDAMREAIDLLAAKFRPGYEKERQKAIEKDYSALCMFELRIDYLSGKKAKELLE